MVQVENLENSARNSGDSGKDDIGVILGEVIGVSSYPILKSSAPDIRKTRVKNHCRFINLSSGNGRTSGLFVVRVN